MTQFTSQRQRRKQAAEAIERLFEPNPDSLNFAKWSSRCAYVLMNHKATILRALEGRAPKRDSGSA